ncbi:hypothetical protein AMJ87_02715 [candidate division WOR_3 bacterium SM23_60]|uniref:Uncharacterized protein n=1 Tax=candidate division WOR_3 bacterium SM23_60 TaxID=1703780 RepID=A0A0S8GK23_UNCW3|nr:MAG: hypothetical protein AMJ87_02715 [candidate division WOR_3 bacterium SM23_60]
MAKQKPVTKIWSDLTQWLEEASRVVGKEAGDLTLKGRLKLEIFDLNRMLKETFTALGTAVYDEVFVKKNDNWRQTAKVMAAIRKIKSTQRKLSAKEKEYKKVGKEAKRKATRKKS